MIEHDPTAIGSSLDWLRNQLRSHGIAIAERSALDLAFARCLELRQCFEVHRGPRLPTPREQLTWFGDAFGIDFMSKLLHRAVLDGLDVPKKLWSALGNPTADVILTRAGKPSQPRDHVWELMLGALCQRVATSVVFAEPDVRCEFRGDQLAIAAKVSYRPRNIWDNAVSKGIKQANGRGSLGLVAVNAANIAPLKTWLRSCRRRGFSPGPRPGEWASAKTARWCDLALDAERGVVTLARPAMPTGIVFFLPILLIVEEQPGVFFYLHMPSTWQGDGGPDFAFVSALCEASKTILDRVDEVHPDQVSGPPPARVYPQRP